MQVGVPFPQSEIGADAKAIRDYAQSAEDLGYEHRLAYDHVLDAGPTNRDGSEMSGLRATCVSEWFCRRQKG